MSEKQIYNDRYRELVEHLRGRRLDLGLTQAQAAHAIGVNRTWISKVENCELSLDLLGLVRFCRAYRLRARDVIEIMEA